MVAGRLPRHCTDRQACEHRHGKRAHHDWQRDCSPSNCHAEKTCREGKGRGTRGRVQGHGKAYWIEEPPLAWRLGLVLGCRWIQKSWLSISSSFGQADLRQ